MKKFENLGRVLSKVDQKRIIGGYMIVMQQSGYNLYNGMCLCDFHYQWTNGSTYDRCYEPCDMSCCQPSYGCTYSYDTGPN